MPATASQKLPAPSPSSNRPPLITSSEAAALASMVAPAHRQGGDIREEAQARGAGQEVGDQGEGVEVPPLVRMVLDADQLQAAPLREPHVVDDLRVLGR